MASKIADRLFETTATTGTGALTLAGAVQGFQSFDVIGNGIKTPYYIDDADNTGIAQNWEAGIGTVTIAGPTVTLSRDTILASSNSNIVVNFGIGTKNVRGGIPAAMLPVVDENLNYVRHRALNATGSTANVHTIQLGYTPLDYSDGMLISYIPPITNTTAGVTVNVNGKGAVSLKYNGADPGVGALPLNVRVFAEYNEAANTFDILNPSPLLVDLASSQNISGKTFTSCGVSNSGAFANQVGYLGAPQNLGLDAANYNLVLTDNGKAVDKTTASARILTIPSNAGVAFPVGSVMIGSNEGAGALTISITTDTLRWQNNTGSRTIAQHGSWALKKLSATVWRLTGDGIT